MIESYGYPLVVTMAENFSVERRKLMRFLGASVVLTPASEKGTGMLAKAVELADEHGWFLCRQFENEANASILCMLPDTGERYLSTPLFADVPSEMTPEEIEISRSTPRYRFDAPPPTTATDEQKKPPPPPAVTPAAAAFLDEVTHDSSNPVLMFALEWCQFCWSVRRMFAAYGIPYQTVDLDSVACQENDWGGQIRAALTAQTGVPTIPQIFVGGEFVGGATDAFDQWRDGTLQQLLERAGVGFSAEEAADPYSFLPSWLHPR